MPKIGDTLRINTILPEYTYYLLKIFYTNDVIFNYFSQNLKEGAKFKKAAIHRSSFSNWEERLFGKSTNME